MSVRRTFTYNGKRYFIRANSEQEFYEKMALKKIELQQETIKETNISFKDYAQEWLEVFKEPYLSQNSIAMYKQTVKLLNDRIGHYRLKDITSTDLQKIITTEHQKGRSKSHIDKIYLTITQIFNRATIDRKISYNPALALIRPKMREQKGRALTKKELKAVLEVAETHKHGMWIRFMLYLGIRPSETCNLTYDDIDKDKMYVYIRKGKTYKSARRIPIPQPLHSDIESLNGSGYIFTTAAGNKLNRDKIKRRWQSFKRDLDIHMGATVYRNQIIQSVLADDLVLYCLRHTYGTNGQAAGIPIDILADLMGHEKIETTRKYYIDDNDESKEKAKEFYNNFYKNNI